MASKSPEIQFKIERQRLEIKNGSISSIHTKIEADIHINLKWHFFLCIARTCKGVMANKLIIKPPDKGNFIFYVNPISLWHH